MLNHLRQSHRVHFSFRRVLLEVPNRSNGFAIARKTREFNPYLPEALHTWNPVVLRQAAVREAVVVVVEVVVMVVVAKAKNNRPCPAGALNPDWTTKGIGSGAARTSRPESTSNWTGVVSSLRKQTINVIRDDNVYVRK